MQIRVVAIFGIRAQVPFPYSATGAVMAVSIEIKDFK